jgi:signal transduction histidine kinase|uniref:histidine kinase n=1 Tax=Desulfobacca acetoxidans TaxID=60893 RepID=A0A7C5AMF6_9BACT
MATPTDLEIVMTRVKEKRQAFKQYNFSFLEDDALKTFFDLAQEYETLDNFYRVVVSVIKEFFNLESRLYLLAPEDRLELVCDSIRGLYPEKPLAPAGINLKSQAYDLDNSWLIPIRGNLLLVDRLPFYAKEQLIGMLEVFPADRLTDHSRFFLEKYANRIGYNLHAKIIAEQNIQHIRFINSLVADIEHNIIVPNISLSLHLRHLREKIKQLKKLEGAVLPPVPEVQEQFHSLLHGLEEDYKNLEQQYKGVSLFIESLFRPSHFQRGQLVLRRKTHRVQREIIEPQLQMFLPRLKERGIEIDVGLGGVPDEEILLSVDKGLMSQVYANLFSNAVKYTRPGPTGRKYISYGREILKDYFGPGKDGVKFNVFSTGPHIPPEDVPHIFEEGYRGSNVDGEVGTGRGLYFVRNVIETHGGVVGYEPTWEGNNFYFILPLVATPEVTTSETQEADTPRAESPS